MPNDLPLLCELLRRFAHAQENDKSLQDQHLAMALGVNPSTVTGWKKKVEEEDRDRIHMNDATREAIADLMNPAFARGYRAASAQVGAVLERMSYVGRVRDALASTAPASDAEGVLARVSEVIQGDEIGGEDDDESPLPPGESGGGQ